MTVRNGCLFSLLVHRDKDNYPNVMKFGINSFCFTVVIEHSDVINGFQIGRQN